MDPRASRIQDLVEADQQERRQRQQEHAGPLRRIDRVPAAPEEQIRRIEKAPVERDAAGQISKIQTTSEPRDFGR